MASPTRTRASKGLVTPHPCLHPNLSPCPSTLSTTRRASPLPLPTTPPLRVLGQAHCRAASATTIRPYSHNSHPPAGSRPYIPTVYSNPPLCQPCGLHVGTLSALPHVHQDLAPAQLATLLSLWTTVNFQKNLLAICNNKRNRFAESDCRSVSSKSKRRHACSSGI